MEIEKKYLIREMPDISQYSFHKIEQGYLNRKPTIRIRKKDDKYIFTYKAKSANKEILVSEEIEREIPKTAYEHLLEKVDGYLVKKTRYLIPIGDGLTAELDVFEGRLDGLVFAEVEFGTEEEAKAFVPPEWFGEDVTWDKRYRNGYLSELEKYEKFI